MGCLVLAAICLKQLSMLGGGRWGRVSGGWADGGWIENIQVQLQQENSTWVLPTKISEPVCVSGRKGKIHFYNLVALGC